MNYAGIDSLPEGQFGIVCRVEDKEALLLFLLGQLLLSGEVVLVEALETRHSAINGGVDGDSLATSGVQHRGDAFTETRIHHDHIAQLETLLCTL